MKRVGAVCCIALIALLVAMAISPPDPFMVLLYSLLIFLGIGAATTVLKAFVHRRATDTISLKNAKNHNSERDWDQANQSDSPPSH